MCSRQNFTPNIILKPDQVITAFNMASKGVGATFIPDALVSSVPYDVPLCYYKMDDDLAIRNVYFYKKRNKYMTKAMEEFLAWCGDDYKFCTWGSMDLTELQRNMVYHGLDIPFRMPLLYYDLQKIYGLIRGDKQKDSLDTVVEELGIAEDRPFHRALDDAYYTGRIMAEMDFYSMVEYVSVDYYRPPETEEDEIYLEFPGYAKFVSRMYDTKERILEERRVTDMVCYKCRRTLRKKIRWFSSNQKFYFCLAYCPEHGYMKGKIRIKKSEDGSVFAVKTTKLIGEDGAALITKKKEEAKKKRADRNKAKRAFRNNSDKSVSEECGTL